VLAGVPAKEIRRWLPYVAAGVAALVWSGQLAGLAGLAVAEGLRWPASLWLGVVVLSAGAAGGLALLTGARPAASTG